MTHARCFTLSLSLCLGWRPVFNLPIHHVAVKEDLVKTHMGLHRWHRKPAKPAESTLRHEQNPFMVGKHYPSYILLKKKMVNIILIIHLFKGRMVMFYG
jgi:hypothetical protein